MEYVDLLLVDDPTELREAVKRVLVDEVRITRSFIGSELRRGKWLGRLDLSLKFSTTVLAAAAAIGAAGTVGAWFTLVTAGAAALLSGFQTAFNPGPTAQAVMGLVIQWRTYLADLEDLLMFDFRNMVEDPLVARARLKELRARRLQLAQMTMAGSDASGHATPSDLPTVTPG